MIKEFKGTGISLDFVLVIWNGPQREEILIAERVYLTHVGYVKIKNQHEGRKPQTIPKQNTEMQCLHLTSRRFNFKVLSLQDSQDGHLSYMKYMKCMTC